MRGYSLGMRQRLGLAAAMLRRPRLLILDEPANGMDPAGIRDLRAALRRLARDGLTVLLSSHDMAQVEEICDSVTVLTTAGSCSPGGLDVMRAEAPDPVWRLRTSDDAAASTGPATLAGVKASPPDNGGLIVFAVQDRLDDYVLQLGRAGIAVAGLELDVTPLESLFFQLTGEPKRRGHEPAGREVGDPRRRPVAGLRRARRRPRNRSGVLVVWRLELVKLGRPAPGADDRHPGLVGPFLAVAVLNVQSATPGDTPFGQWVHTSGFALPMVILGFGGQWLLPVLPPSWPGTSSPPRTSSAPGRPS